MATPLAQIFNAASCGRLQQRGSLAALAKALKDSALPPTQAFLDCLDATLPARASPAVEHALDFAARAAFLKDGALLAPALKVRRCRRRCLAAHLRARLTPHPSPRLHPPPLLSP